MGNYELLKAAINDVIKANGRQEITGEVLNQVLLSMVNSLGAGYQCMGVATPSTNPGTPDQNVFYFATQAGTYTNFDAIVLQAGISVLIWDGDWESQTWFTVDSTPTNNSQNLIASGAVFNALKLDGGAYDVSAHNSGATFASLSALLNSANLNTLIPTEIRHGGMSIKFVQSSDNNYIQEVYASIGAWDGNTGAINTKILTRANLKIAAIGKDSITVIIPSGYYANFYYVNADNVVVDAILVDWQGVGTVSFELNGLYDLMLNIKYGTAGNTNITATMLASAPFIVTNNKNKYVQYRYLGTAVTGNPNPFLDTANWQGVDDEPTAGSENLVTSSGIDRRLMSSKLNGNGSNFISSIHYLIPGHTYRLTHIHYPYNVTGFASGLSIFTIESCNNEDIYSDLVRVRVGISIDKEYIFTVPNNSKYILIGGRTIIGDYIFYQLEDVTDFLSLPLIRLEKSDMDASGTGQVGDAIRLRYIYNNTIQVGDVIYVKANTGYKVGITRCIGALEFVESNANSYNGHIIDDSGWIQECYLRINNPNVSSIMINSKKDNNGKISIVEHSSNISILVIRNGNGSDNLSYSGKPLKISTVPKFEAYKFMDISYSGNSGQGAAIYNDYFIQGGDGGQINIYDLTTLENVASNISLGSAGANNHCNNISLGVEKPSGGIFPYLYISQCNYAPRSCFVENLTLSTSTLVQTLTYSGSKFLNGEADHDWVVDRENKYLYIVGNTKSAYNVEGNMIGIAKFRLPKISEGDIVFTDSDLLDYFELEGSAEKLNVYQGTYILNDKLFFAFGGAATSHRFAVINLSTHLVETVVELDQVYSSGEPESINIYKDCIMIGYPNQRKLYSLFFT